MPPRGVQATLSQLPERPAGLFMLGNEAMERHKAEALLGPRAPLLPRDGSVIFSKFLQLHRFFCVCAMMRVVLDSSSGSDRGSISSGSMIKPFIKRLQLLCYLLTL